MWYQLTIDCSPQEELDKLNDYLEEAGALSITLTDKNDEPILEPAIGTTPVWRENVVQALFGEQDEAEQALRGLMSQLPWVTGQIEPIMDQDWQRASMDSFSAQQFGSNLWICPSWVKPPCPDAVNVILDPGLAFGTGTHPTTSLCLQWLAQASLNQLKMIDYGAGSGILSIAALKLGAALVQAVDLDDQALQATAANALMNDLTATQLRVGLPEILLHDKDNDLVMANILLGPLLTLKMRFKELLQPQGLLVVSGILREQTEQLIAYYAPEFGLQETQFLEDWALVCFKRE